MRNARTQNPFRTLLTLALVLPLAGCLLEAEEHPDDVGAVEALPLAGDTLVEVSPAEITTLELAGASEESSASCGASAWQDEADMAVDQAQPYDPEAALADDGGWATEAQCTADCGDFADVTCSATACSAVNRNCGSGQQGYVECNGVRTYCPVCAVCTEGQVRWRSTSACCCNRDDEANPIARGMLMRDTCVNGAWVYTGSFCDGGNCGGICPL